MKTVMVFITASLFSLPVLASEAYGEPFEGWGFVKDDWQVVCDNTLTCRAAGYAVEGQWDMPASILLTATPKKALPTAQVQFLLDTADKTKYDVELWLNNKNQGKLQPSSESYIYDLTVKQTQSLISSARLNTKIEVKAAGKRWTVSDKGMGAVLLKLDEVQGRVGTPLALVSKNHASKQTPKAAKPKPIIEQAFAYSATDNKTLKPSKLVYFENNIDKWVDIDAEQLIGSEDVMGDCELVNPKTETYQRLSEYGSTMLGWDFIPIDDSHTLASHLCWQAAYNAASGYWVIDHASPSQPKLITTSGTNYRDGNISANHKDRGIGDCWNSATWTWNGQTFAKSEEASAGMCRGFAGGAWNLPTYVSQVIKNNKTQ